MSKTCLVYNFAQHYRKEIFSLMDKGLDIVFYFGDKMGDVKKLNYDIFQHPVHEVKNYQFGPLKWQSHVAWLGFKKKYKTFIMLGEPMTISTWILLLTGKLLGKRMIFWTHGWYGREGVLKKIIKKVFFGLADYTLTYGEYARNLMIEAGLDGEKIKVIHNSLAYSEQLSLREHLSGKPLYTEHFQNNHPVIVFIGRLTPVKKLHMLLQACVVSKQKNSNYNLVFVGDGEEKERLIQETKDLEIEGNVWFYGPSYDEKELSELLYNADVCVAPGNIGLTAMHAMSYGCPCISHDDFTLQMPEFEAINEGVTGSFFKYNDVDSLSTCIDNWITTHSNDREQIRTNCFREIDERWNPYRQMDLLKQVVQ